MRKLMVALGGLFLCLAANAQNVAIGSLTAQGVDCTTAGACITLQFEGNDVGSASIQLSGTFTATVQFEASSDKGTTWVAISGTPLNSSTAVTSATTANTWKFNVASITNIRARASAWTSAPTVVIRSSRAVANAIGGGGAVFASGGTTNNVIPKSNGAGQLADSSCTDNATNVICTEPIVLPTSITACAMCISGSTTSGLTMDHQASGPRFSIIEAGARRHFAVDSNAGTVTLASGTSFGWNSSATDPLGTSIDTSLTRDAAGFVALKGASNAIAGQRIYGGNGDYEEYGTSTELLTIAAAATTDSVGNLLPANSIIDSVDVRVTTVIPTAATFTVGDATIAARFATGVSAAANTTAVGITQVDQTGTSGPKQVAAAKVRITPNATPGTATGVVRIVVHYRSFTPPTS